MISSLTEYSMRDKIFLSKFTLVCGLLLVVAPAMGADYLYTVKPGDHPWNLAERYLKRPEMGLQLRSINHIPDDHNILPGVQLRIPMAWLKLKPMQVQVVAASGDATVVRSGTGAALIVGAVLRAPATVKTGAVGSASLLFADGSRVLVRAQSEVQLKQVQQQVMSGANLVELLLTRGSLENQIIPMHDSGGRFEIRTPAAVAAVRGTDFRVSAQKGELRTEVLAGRVSVANPAGEVFTKGGEGSVARGDGLPPKQPVPLLGAPNLGAFPERIERLPVDLPFAPLSGATAYRTQIAPSNAFETLLSDEVSVPARVRARDIEDGTYVIRVRAIDAQGLEGVSAQRALVLHARPEAPILIEPAPDAVVEFGLPTFRWTQGDPGWRYRMQVMEGSNPTPVLDQSVDSGAMVKAAQVLPPGVYQWRVAAIQPEKGQGPWGDVQRFRRVMPGPGVAKPEAVDGIMVLRWAGQASADAYQLQVSVDAGFTNPQVDVRTDQPQYHFSDLTGGRYYVRVSAVGADGFIGPWGGTQTFEVMPPAPSRWPILLLLLPLLGML